MKKKSSLFVAATFAVLGATAASAATEPVVTPAAIAAAKTPADHESIARTYDTEAARLDAEAATQAELAKLYGSYTSPMLYSAAMEKQCKELARDLKASAELNRKLAALHRRIAAELSK